MNKAFGEFFAAYPETTQGMWCMSCGESTEQIRGISVNYRGIIRTYMCKCGLRTFAKDEGNPFEEINNKLDKLLRRFGYDD